MRKVAAPLLALPILVGVYVGLAFRRSIAARIGLALGVGATLGLAGLGLLSPAAIRATPPDPVRALPDSAFSTGLQVDRALGAGATFSFSVPMDVASVAAALTVDPAGPVRPTWDAAGRTLTVNPASSWAPATYYTITIGTTARDATGRRLERPARVIFLTRGPTTARLVATVERGDRIGLDAAFVLAFDRSVPTDEARASFRIEPPVAGTFVTDGAVGTTDRLTFTPDAPLAPETSYRVSMAPGLTDADGAPVALPDPLVVRTLSAPAVVRFRPLAGAAGVSGGVPVSVRFSEPMDRAATAAAFSVIASGALVTKGVVNWAESDTVLVFRPAVPFDPGTTVALSVARDARSAAGVTLVAAATATFTTAPRPAPPVRRPATRPATRSRSVPIASGGGSVGTGTWAAVESYYLKLMNCTRTGGWVTADGSCSSPGGRDVAPLRLDAGISSGVARPYARYLATHDVCTHFIGGTPGTRLREAGYESYRWAENLGCRSGDPMAAVLATHLFFQSERPYGGGHWVNLMSPAYDRVGIGVWVSRGIVRLVVDFYRP